MNFNLNNTETIVIGGSAGAVQVLKKILQSIPDSFGLVIIVVLHRFKDDISLLEDVMTPYCKLKVHQAEDKEMIIPGQVYFAPPNYHLLIEHDRSFALSCDAPVHFSRPSISVLFESAAAVYKSSLLGILLTGANEDGTTGISTICDQGGMTIVQDPAEAEHSIMPAAALATKKVNYIMSTSQICSVFNNQLVM